MNKENKRKAQEERAKLRAKKEQKEKILKPVIFWGPIVGVVIIIIVLIWAVASSGSAPKNTNEVEVEAGTEDVVLDLNDSEMWEVETEAE